MIYIVDTNVMLRYLLHDDRKQSPIATQYLTNNQLTFFISSQMLCEVIWFLRYSLKVQKSELVLMLEQIIATPHFICDTGVDMGLQFLKQGGDFADGIIAYNVQKFDNACLLSFDKKAQKIAKELQIQFVKP